MEDPMCTFCKRNISMLEQECQVTIDGKPHEAHYQCLDKTFGYIDDHHTVSRIKKFKGCAPKSKHIDVIWGKLKTIKHLGCTYDNLRTNTVNLRVADDMD